MIAVLKQLNEAWCGWLFSERADKFFSKALKITLTLLFGKMAIQYIIVNLLNL